MSDLRVMIPLAIALFGVLLWLLRPGRRFADAGPTSIALKMGSNRPRHYQFFPQIRQALSSADDEYLCKATPPHITRQVRRERRAIARNFLRGLREDFANLEELGRMVAALSPVVSRQQETERLMLSLKFQLLYAFVFLNLSAGNTPLREIERLTGLVGRLTTRMEQAMSQISALAAEQNSHGLKA